MITFEQISDTHIRVFHDGIVIYDSYNDRSTRYYTEAFRNELDDPLERGLVLKALAESHY